ncbi:MAG: VF530 family DNA-binding protein [Oleispira sp.]|nr:VF530 family DNA-binding protein [Oleispira sp.]MBL4879934.1 VF530 family DNA-binding protein [Oleispira sp.]
MNDKTNYQNNPLHGIGLGKLITILSEHYGFEILYAYLNINCFNANPSIESSEKFLKKTDWAREKVEGFYLYEYKSLPRASAKEFELPPRDRTIPQDQETGEPNELSLEDAEQLREKRAKKAAEFGNGTGYRNGKKFGGEKDRSKTTPYRTSKPSRPSGSSSSPYGGEQKTSKPFGGNSYSSSFDKKDDKRDSNQDAGSKTPSRSDSDPWGTKSKD